MVKHIQIIRRQLLTNCLRVFDHFVGLALKGLIKFSSLDEEISELHLCNVCVIMFPLVNL